MFIKIAPTTLVNTDQITGVTIRDGQIHIDCINRIYKIDPEGKATDNPVWKYFNKIALMPGESKQEQPEQMGRRELARELFEYGRHFASCQIDMSKGLKCDCGFDHAMRQAQSILEQSS